MDGNVEAKEELGSAIFLYLIGSNIKVLLDGEGIEISQAKLNLNVGKNMFVIYENERIVEILQRAGEAHDQILQTENDTVEAKEYHHQLGLLTYAYIRSRNEELLKGFTVMRSTIVKMIA